jgi:hypothetical protein
MICWHTRLVWSAADPEMHCPGCGRPLTSDGDRRECFQIFDCLSESWIGACVTEHDRTRGSSTVQLINAIETARIALRILKEEGRNDT